MNIASNKKSKVAAARPISKLASRAYSEDRIARNTHEGSRKGESMDQIVRKIMTDPDIEIGRSDRRGNQSILHRGKDIGWMNPNRGIGWIDDKAYRKLNPSEDSEVEHKSVNDDGVVENDDVQAVVEIKNEEDLRAAIKNLLDEDLCTDLVNLAFSEDNLFSKEAFMDADTFFETLDYDDDPKRLSLMFFNGEDLDSRGPANPNRNYFRLDNTDNIESTDYPGEIYMGTLDDEVIDYIIDHVSDRTYPDEIQELVDEYLEHVEA